MCDKNTMARRKVNILNKFLGLQIMIKSVNSYLHVEERQLVSRLDLDLDLVSVRHL